jgi:3-oxosteroid 1-dehydrogenase
MDREVALAFSEEWDVIIVGSGISGLAAALAAHEQGMRPLVIESAAHLGGGTSLSYGLIWIAQNHLAEASGYHDDRAEVLRYLHFLGGGAEDEERLLTFVTRGPEALAFFAGCGLRFQIAKGIKDHYPEAPGASTAGRSVEHVPISGLELGQWRERIVLPRPPYNMSVTEMVAWGGIENYSKWDAAEMADRRRRDLRGMGVGLVSGFVKALLDRNVALRTNTRAERLIAEAGRIIGVELADGARLGARKGVLLAAGGYESNPKLAEEFEGLPGWLSMFPESLAGDALVMAAEQGAVLRIIHNSFRLHLGFLIPDENGGSPAYRDSSIIELCSPHTMVVNRAGRRFANEASFQAMGPKLREFDGPTHRHPNLPCFLIFDRDYAAIYSFAGLPASSPIPNWVARADSIAALAAQLGIDPAGLAATTARFNDFAASGVDADFGRGSEQWRLAQHAGGGKNPRLGAIATPPFYGLELHPSGPASAGILANAQAQVLHQRRQPVPGLYVSGNAAAHTEFGVGYQAGFSLASGLIFSYLAVRHMLEASA